MGLALLLRKDSLVGAAEARPFLPKVAKLRAQP